MTLPEDTLLENRYRIDGLLAHGGMGAIYRAFDTNLSTPVAIKENFFQTPHRIAQFKQEALILARLRHPSLPRVSHHFSFEGQQYLVMDFIEGENLWEITKRRGEPLGEREALDYLIQVCHAVGYLHRQTPPIIHRDIKPQNIKITPDNRAILVDFGIAKQITGTGDQTGTGAQAATPGFSPPEQYSGEGTTPVSDIYALGATLYAVLTGKKPPVSVSLMVGSAKFKAPNLVNPKLSRKTTQSIVHAMQPAPHLRPQTIEEWLRRLEAVMGTMPMPPDKEDTLTSRPRSKTSIQETLTAVSSSVPVTSTTGFWLVDSKGVGYPLEAEPLRIGRHSQADVTLEDLNVSRFNTQVKIDGKNCFVLDENSANGTFLNGYRLEPEWYPFNQGDVLIVGPARFYLTTTQPAKLAAPKPKTTPAAQQTVTAVHLTHPMEVAPALPSAAPKKQKSVGLLVSIFFVVLAAVVGIGGYLWVNPTAGVYPGAVPPVETKTTPTETPTVARDIETVQALDAETAVAAVALTAQVEELAKATPPAKEPVPTKGGQTKTATLPVTESSKSATPLKTDTPLATTTKRATLTPTLTRTPTPTNRVPVSSGPTAIPLKFSVSVAELGFREVIDVDINPRNTKEVYALVKRDGIYKSVNGGDGPWARIDLDGSGLTALAVDPQNPTQLYAPTWNAVLKSTDGGNTWDAKTNGLVSNRAVDLIVIHPAASNILYAGVGENLVVSTDKGETWKSQEYGVGLGVSRLNQIVIDPFNANTVYVAGPASSIYKSENGGQSFVQLPYNVGKGAFGMAAHPSRENVILAGINSAGAGIIKTENGLEFRSVSDGLIYGGADSAYSAIVFAAGNPQIVYAGSGFESEPDSKGIFKSSDGGESWQRINIGLSINPDTGYPHYVKSMVVHPIDPNIVFAATGSGLYKSSDGGQSWSLR